MVTRRRRPQRGFGASGRPAAGRNFGRKFFAAGYFRSLNFPVHNVRRTCKNDRFGPGAALGFRRFMAKKEKTRRSRPARGALVEGAAKGREGASARKRTAMVASKTTGAARAAKKYTGPKKIANAKKIAGA